MVRLVVDAEGKTFEPVLVEMNRPLDCTSPPDMKRPLVVARPAALIPPEKVEVPVSVLVMRPERERLVAERSADEMEPVKVEVPWPETLMRSPTEKEVEEAMGKRLASVVEVALKILAVKESVKTPAPVTESAVPGVPVAMPRRWLEGSTTKKFSESRMVVFE